MFLNSMGRILDALTEAGARCWSWTCTLENDAFDGVLRATHDIELPFLWDWTNDVLAALAGSVQGRLVQILRAQPRPRGIRAEQPSCGYVSRELPA